MHQNVCRTTASQEIRNEVENLRVQDGGCLKIFSSSGGARQNEYSGTNDGANPQRRETDPPKRFFEASFRVLRVRDKLVDTLATEEL